VGTYCCTNITYLCHHYLSYLITFDNFNGVLKDGALGS
jgi:hypothetical protein